MFNHCGRKFKASEVWFLSNNNDCIDRVLYIGFCPRCLLDFTCLIETNKKDNVTYCKVKQGKKAVKEIELCRLDKLYTNLDLQIKKGKPYGWVFIEGKEIHDRKGNITKIRYYEYDNGGQRALYREFSGNSPFMCKSL